MSHGCDIIGGKEFTGWPSMVVDVRSAVAHRIQEWLAFRYHVAGELYYQSVEAYGTGSIYAHGGNGDGTLFYPGPNIPIASIRLALMRDAEEDYEYLHLLAAHDPARADAIAARIARTPRDWDADSRALLAARHALAVAISNGVTKQRR